MFFLVLNLNIGVKGLKVFLVEIFIFIVMLCMMVGWKNVLFLV